MRKLRKAVDILIKELQNLTGEIHSQFFVCL